MSNTVHNIELDRFYIDLALTLAVPDEGRVKPNPLVGTVIVKRWIKLLGYFSKADSQRIEVLNLVSNFDVLFIQSCREISHPSRKLKSMFTVIGASKKRDRLLAQRKFRPFFDCEISSPTVLRPFIDWLQGLSPH